MLTIRAFDLQRGDRISYYAHHVLQQSTLLSSTANPNLRKFRPLVNTEIRFQFRFSTYNVLESRGPGSSFFL